jgi:hypothetical protein
MLQTMKEQNFVKEIKDYKEGKIYTFGLIKVA